MGWDQPDLSVEAVEMRERVVQGVELRLDLQLVFFPPDETDIDCMVPGAALVGKGLVCRLD